MELHFGDTSVTVCAWGTLIALPDGTLIPGAPQDDAAYRTTAERHGYGPDTLQLCIDHEILHVALADWLACQSPTLEALQTQRLDDNLLLRGLEEDAVLAIQRYARMAGIDIVELFASRSRGIALDIASSLSGSADPSRMPGEVNMSKTDAEIYADVGKRRWPYVDEPTNKGHQRKRRLDGEGTAVVNRPTPKPLAPAGAEATKDDHSR